MKDFIQFFNTLGASPFMNGFLYIPQWKAKDLRTWNKDDIEDNAE